MRICTLGAYCYCFLGLALAQPDASNRLPSLHHNRNLKGSKKEKGSKKGSSFPSYDDSFLNDVNRYYYGLWEGIDPLDGTQMQRTIMPIASNNYTVVGRIEFSEICGSGTEAGMNITSPPNKTSNLIPARLLGVGQVDKEGSLNTKLSITCFGDNAPRISNISVKYEPIEENILWEIPVFRANAPILFFRVSQPVGRLYAERR